MLPQALIAPSAGGWALIGGTAFVIVGLATLLARYPNVGWPRMSFLGESVVRCGFIVLLTGLSVSAIHPWLGPAGQLIASAKRGDLNPMEMAEIERGYYENLMDIHRFNSDLWGMYSQRSKEYSQSLIEAGIARPTNDLRCWELLPNVTTHYWGANVRTNSLGMSDKEYTIAHPPRCFRIALLGASHEMALGVDPAETFHALVEDRLNLECRNAEYDSYEILNFAVAGYFSIPHVWVMKERVLPFRPDAVLYTAHARDASRVVYWLVAAHRDGIKFEEPYLQDLCRQLGIDEKTPEALVRKRLNPHAEELLSWAYRRIVAICRESGIPCYFVLLPMLDANQDDLNMRIAKDAGFVILDALDAYQGQSIAALRTVQWDGHPNVRGHQLLARKVFDVIRDGGVIPNPVHRPDGGQEAKAE
jgi:alginate O-acetyltransferase complex protein AlgI